MKKKYNSSQNTESQRRLDCFFTVLLVMPVVALCVILVVMLAKTGGVLGQGNNYLYVDTEGGKSVEPVIEYIFREKKPDEDEADWLKEEMNPPFLTTEGNDTPHIVCFYAPWCGHCQHYKPLYIKQARDVARSYPQVKFYAVSCAAHNKLCNEQKIRGFPTIRWYPVGSGGVGEDLGRPIEVKKVGELLEKDNERNDNKAQLTLQMFAKQDAKNQKVGKVHENRSNKPFQWVDRHDVFHDALASFEYALHHAIYMTNEGLQTDQSRTLRDWLNIIEKVSRLSRQSLSNTETSPLVRLHLLSSTLLDQFDYITEKEENLSQIVHDLSSSHEEEGWTRACTNNGNPGYTCGLWELFHMVTIGTAKMHQNPSESIAPSEVAETLRDYIQHYFACEVCRVHFLHMYDECHFDRCNRFEKENDPSGHQLALWLWEVHNSVNVRLYHERLQENNNNAIFSAKDDQSAKWPSIESCPTCWNADGTWSEDEIFNALEKQYWPVGVALDDLNPDTDIFSFNSIMTLVGLCIIIFVFKERRRIAVSGYHKKSDDNHVC